MADGRVCCCVHRTFLLESLRATSTEAIQHGACLGLGLAGLGTQDEEVYEDLKNVLYMDSAVSSDCVSRDLPHGPLGGMCFQSC